VRSPRFIKVLFNRQNLKTPKKSRFSNSDPLYTGGGIKYVVTIHDLAFKFFPDHFPLIDKLKINFYTDIAIKKADKIIAISKSTKKDIIKLYPRIDAGKIEVVHHGFDRENFRREFNEKEVELFLRKYNLVQNVGDSKSLKFESKVHKVCKVESQQPAVVTSKKNRSNVTNRADYLLYVGAIQPRKDLVTLIRSFEDLKRDEFGGHADLKLVLAGEVAWKSDSTVEAVKTSEFTKDIIMTGRVSFKELALFYRFAKVFVFPSLYEGFGIPLLEAMTSKTPVVVADNSSLGEVGGGAVLKFKSGDTEELTAQIKKLLDNEDLQQEMIERGLSRIEKFSWEKCANKTLKVIKSFK
ncbi:MAG TPA: glycosyltransferase family 1 protein, partial [Lutibacter sp.]|nr:glycosyltransferase family 1 protein [Lutibacter sp.]